MKQIRVCATLVRTQRSLRALSHDQLYQGPEPTSLRHCLAHLDPHEIQTLLRPFLWEVPAMLRSSRSKKMPETATGCASSSRAVEPDAMTNHNAQAPSNHGDPPACAEGRSRLQPPLVSVRHATVALLHTQLSSLFTFEVLAAAGPRTEYSYRNDGRQQDETSVQLRSDLRPTHRPPCRVADRMASHTQSK